MKYLSDRQNHSVGQPPRRHRDDRDTAQAGEQISTAAYTRQKAYGRHRAEGTGDGAAVERGRRHREDKSEAL